MLCMTSTATKARQPKGIPVGGQFSSVDRDESTIDLAAPAPATLSDREILEQSITLARHAGIRAGLSDHDIEDIAQETVFSVLRTRDRNNAPITGGLLRVASRALVSRLVDSHIRHEDSAALTAWKQKSAAIEQELGRHLTPGELDTLATEIRDNWHNPRHKPRIGFQHQVRFASTEAMGAMFSDVVAAPTTHQDSRQMLEMAESVEDRMIDPAVARLRIWNILAADSGAPRANEAALERKAAKAHKEAVADAVDVARAFLDGTGTDEQAASLFAPFGDLDARQRKQAARAIVSRPAVGDKLWRSALDFATKPVAPRAAAAA